ncbi:MAG: AraC family transcriptional regulator [Clostridia bacterium]|nr:AraC family transcriptional regulator [Clostridia bacterium]
MDWLTGLNQALAYIEEHLTDRLSAEDVAAQAYMSPFHFQKMFSALCGMTLGEYIRGRRLTCAAQALSLGGLRVIDAALRYGYDSPDSFARAFVRFHGVSPSKVRESGASLNALAPLRIHVILEGGSKMEYRIVEKPAFTIIGAAKQIRSESSYADVPAFWEEHMNSPAGREFHQYGACINVNADTFTYMIANPYPPQHDAPQGMSVHTFPAGMWAVFPCRGALPDALQAVNTRIWREWLPSLSGYRLGGDYSIEAYTPAPERPEDTYTEIWVPLHKQG